MAAGRDEFVRRAKQKFTAGKWEWSNYVTTGEESLLKLLAI